jgi:hypothetical protein
MALGREDIDLCVAAPDRIVELTAQKREEREVC